MGLRASRPLIRHCYTRAPKTPWDMQKSENTPGTPGASKSPQNYGEKLTDIASKGIIATVMGMAYELGIPQLLVQTQKPLTSQEIADTKDLKERYVREAMNSLACAGVVGVSKDGNGHVRYSMTLEQGQAMESVGLISFLPSMATRYEKMFECFQKDGPYCLPFSDDKRAMTACEKTGSMRLDEQVELILSKVPGIEESLESGIKVIEFGSGRGRFLTAFATKFPKSQFLGSDVTEPAAQILRERCTQLNLTNITVKTLDILNIPDDLIGQFDFAFVNDVIHDLPDAQEGIRGCHKVLRPGCYFAFIDIDGHSDVMTNRQRAAAPVSYAISTFHCVAQAYQDRESVPLGSCWGRDVAVQMVERSRFKLIGQHPHCEYFILYVCQAEN